MFKLSFLLLGYFIARHIFYNVRLLMRSYLKSKRNEIQPIFNGKDELIKEKIFSINKAKR